MTLALAWRSLKRTPVFTLVAIGMLWLGTAAAGALFAILHGVLLAPLPYREPERLVGVRLEAAELRRMGHSPALQSSWERHARSLAGVGLYRSGGANVRAPGAADAENVASAWVSASLLPLLGVAPLLGRSFDAEEERRGGPDAVILSESEWRSRYRAAAEVLGQILIVNDVPRAIVGVMPDGFAFPFASTRLWLPLKRAPAQLVEDTSYACVARLAAGVTPEQALVYLPQAVAGDPGLGPGPRASMALVVRSEGPQAAVLTAIRQILHELDPSVPVFELRPMQELLHASTARLRLALALLSAAAVVALLIGAIGLYGVLACLVALRRREFGVRVALGASPQQIGRLVLLRGLSLAGAGSAPACCCSCSRHRCCGPTCTE